METRVLSNLALYGALVMSKDDAGFPENPVIGTMIIKDQCLFAYLKIGGMETWYPFANKTNSYIHTQGLPSDAWIINHELGTTDIWYQVKDNLGNVVLVGKTDIDENSFQLDFTTPITGTCIVVAPDSINVPTIKALEIDVANGAVVIDSSGVLIDGSYALTASNIEQQIADAIATKDNSDEITEGTTNLYYTNTRARASVSVTDAGGDGSLSYNNSTGVFTYTGPSASEVRAHLSQGTGISYSSTTGVIAVNADVEMKASKGQANGYASLDASGLVPASQLPSFVDDVLEYVNLAGFPVTGETSKIYVAVDTNRTYRWTGTIYVEISPTAGNADSATKLLTSRSISATGDAAWTVNFDGTANVTAGLTLASTGVVADTYSSVTVDAKGRVIGGTKTEALEQGTVASFALSTLTTSENQVIASISATTYRTVKALVQATSGTSYHSTELIMVHNGTDVSLTEYGTAMTGASIASFDADISEGLIRLLVTPVNANTTVRVILSAVNI